MTTMPFGLFSGILSFISAFQDVDDENSEGSEESNQTSSKESLSAAECKVWRNSMNLLRGAELNLFQTKTGREPLTFYDMNLSAQDHQNLFTCDCDSGKEEYEIMQRAWRERDGPERIAAAHRALEINPECSTALILLAEEEASTVSEALEVFQKAYKAAESNRKENSNFHVSSESQQRRDINVLYYVRRRIAMCLRRLGKLKEAIKAMRDLIKEYPTFNIMNVHENLVEALFETQAYADAQAVLARYDDLGLPRSAVIVYSQALLRARAVSSGFSPDVANKKGLSAAETQAVEAVHRAIEYNPHVPKYLIELKPLTIPPEHVLKRGESEAIAYAFWHLQHWKRVDGALALLQYTWEGSFRMLPYQVEKGYVYYPQPDFTQTEAADRELLPADYDVPVYSQGKELSIASLFFAGLCSGTAVLAVLTHQYPKEATDILNACTTWIRNVTFRLLDFFSIGVAT